MNKFKLEHLVLLVVIIVYFMISSVHLEIPFLDSCEGQHGIGAWQVLSSKERIYDGLMGTTIFGRYLPVMSDRYQTALPDYFLIPFFYLFGVSVSSIRICGIFFGAVTLILTYVFARRIFNEKIAIVTVLLLFMHPIFVAATKSGIYYRAPIILMTVGSLLCFLEWYRGKSILYYYLGIFLLGVGLSVQVAFIFFCGALVFTLLLFFKAVKKRILKDEYFILKYCLGTILFFLFGAILFLVYNIYTPGDSIKCIFEYFPVSRAGIDNRFYFGNLYERLMQFSGLLTNSRGFFPLGEGHYKINSFYLISFLASIIWIFISYWLDREKHRKVIVLASLIFFSLILSPLVIATSATHQLFFLYPLPQMLIVYGAFDFIQTFSNKKVIVHACYVFFPILMGVIVYGNIMIFKSYYLHCSKTGGLQEFFNTAALYGLVDWFKKNKVSEYVPLSDQLSHNIFFLTKGRSYPLASPSHLGEIINGSEVWLKNKEQIYIASLQDLERFSDFMKEKNKNIVPIKKFYTRDNQPNIIAFKIK